MKAILSAAIVVTLAVVTLGCDWHHRFDDGSFFFYFEGSWSGSVHDSTCGDGSITFVFVQVGDHVSGSWRIVFFGTTDTRCYDPDSPRHELSGPLSGSLNGSSVGLTLQRAQGSAGCSFKDPIALTGTWTRDHLVASYSGTSCSGTVTGTVDARR